LRAESDVFDAERDDIPSSVLASSPSPARKVSRACGGVRPLAATTAMR
jgi:hypothetical protein